MVRICDSEQREPRNSPWLFSFSWEQRKLGEISIFNPKSELPEKFEYVDLESVVGTEIIAHREEQKSTAPSRAQRLAQFGYLFYQTVRKKKKNNCLFESHCKSYVFSTGYAQIRPFFNGYFLLSLVQSDLFVKRVLDRCTGTSYPAINSNDLAEMSIKKPCDKREIEKIGQLFRSLDRLITLHQCKYFYASPKSGIFHNEKTNPWEQRKFSELVLIERGGSPRPIDKFITDAPDGLNWVKIGDAPILGKYIMQTAEKIKPEGLSKTRQVQPGDLILSNSMSFGKPYIMGIFGCIHDGWLLIRNIKKIFDQTFLCHLLGTEQLLTQYRALAAGSTVNNLNKELVGSAKICFPKIEEQRQIGVFLEHLDRLITLHQREYLLF